MKPNLATGGLLLLAVGSSRFTGFDFGTLLVVIVLGILAAWDARAVRVKAFLVSLLPVVLGSILSFIKLIYRYEPYSYDRMLATLDASLGVSPSQVIFPVFRNWAGAGLYYFVYLNLAAAVVVSCAWAIYLKRSRELIFAILVNALIAPIFYSLLPASGPIYAQPTHAMPNCVPSVHFSTALILWYFNRRLGRGFEIATLLFAGLTALSTLTTGEHYLVDLLLSPALALAAICFAHKAYSHFAFWFSTITACLLLGRVAGTTLAHIPFLFWAANLVILVTSFSGLRARSLATDFEVSATIHA